MAWGNVDPAAGAAAGAAGVPFLPLALSLAPGLLQHLFGGESPQDKLRRQIQELLNPENQAKLSSQFYQQNLGSPAYAQGQRTIAAGANITGANLANRLGASGISNSGSGALLSSLIPSIVGGQQAGLRTSAYNSAQQQAQQNIQQQIQALMGTMQQGPGATSQLFGHGFEAFAPFLTGWLKQRGYAFNQPAAASP